MEVTLVTGTGEEYLLTGSERTSRVLAPEGALVSLTGEAERSDLAVPARSGVVPGKRRFKPVDTTIEFLLVAESHEEMERLYWSFRRAWLKTVAAKDPAPCVFRIDGARGTFFVDAVLGGVLPGVDVEPARRLSMRLEVPVFNARGLARSAAFVQSGTVTVTNTGDGVIYPKIRRNGTYGYIVSPSGARFHAGTKMPDVIDTDPMVLREDGIPPEGVEPGETATWELPGSRIELEWCQLVADPWG
ncbi:hypothetical protein [Corynebacterium sp. HMSC072A04]|uniref:hypothetical protein n=1 Tax=Corynebacterium sp. HMSC072A04 TaxID=1715045 RepID=UPI0008B2ED8A|nr:hypothetical protein [Corynebacterium sp. HMSC072A04]OFN33609.1 hypothetical protein HMPREF2565_11770 [Corynebacterium sp. HMSC072A04]